MAECGMLWQEPVSNWDRDRAMSDTFCVRCRKCGWIHAPAGRQSTFAKCWKFRCPSAFAGDFEVIAEDDPRVPVGSTLQGIRWPLPDQGSRDEGD
jgi:hypothetical protein